MFLPIFLQIILSALFSLALAAPQFGPLTPLVGNLVQTPRGLQPIDLDGFSEDLDQDGFVDPIAPVAPAVYQAAPIIEAAPIAYQAAPIIEAAPIDYQAAPIVQPAPFAYQGAPYVQAAPLAYPAAPYAGYAF